MAKTKTAVPGTSLARWDEKLASMAKQAKQAVSGIGGGGNFISLKGGNLSYQGKVIPGNKMNVIVIDWCRENQKYDAAFDESNPQSPDCYAFGLVTEDIKLMGPKPEDVAHPCNPTCFDCEYRQWGSADVGKGKACSEVARLALIAEGEFGEVETAEIAYLKVPVTSMTYWAGYVRQLDEVYHKPPMAFVTELSVVPQQKRPGWHVEAKMVSAIEDAEAFTALFKRYDEVSKTIAFPYPKIEAAEEAPAPKRNGAATRRAPVAAKPKAASPVAPAAVAVGARKPVRVPKF